MHKIFYSLLIFVFSMHGMASTSMPPISRCIVSGKPDDGCYWYGVSAMQKGWTDYVKHIFPPDTADFLIELWTSRFSETYNKNEKAALCLKKIGNPLDLKKFLQVANHFTNAYEDTTVYIPTVLLGSHGKKIAFFYMMQTPEAKYVAAQQKAARSEPGL